MSKSERVIAITGLLVSTIGVISSIVQGKHFPDARFWIGLGFVYVVVSALAEWEPAIAEPLSLAILTTVLLGESSSGVLSFISKRGEFNTAAPKPPQQATTPIPAKPNPGKPTGNPPVLGVQFPRL